MRQDQHRFTVSTQGKGMYEFTDGIAEWVAGTGIATGLLTLFCRHTSAGLLINENAAPAVQRDLLRWFDVAAPESGHYEHDDEGPDDMPAHIRTLLTGSPLTIPVADGRPVLGTWQGIFLAEHRARPHDRQVVAHIIGD